jgi:hypothetical protein
MNDLTGTLQAASAAVTGDATPEAIKATQAVDGRLVWALVLAGPVLCALVAWSIWVLAYSPWPDGVAGERVKAVAWIGLGLVACVCLVVWRLAGVKRLEAKAGPVQAIVDS